MKEIDFLPQWYKQSKRHQSRVQRQYAVLGVIFLMMVIWNSMALRSINEADAQLVLVQPQRAQAERIGEQFRWTQRRWDRQSQWLKQVEQLDTQLDVAAVLMELSHLIGPQIEVEDMTVVAQTVQEVATRASLSCEPVVYRCSLQGTSETPEAVGQVINAMESSDRFQRVRFRYSPDPETKTLTHYELWCDLARDANDLSVQ